MQPVISSVRTRAWYAWIVFALPPAATFAHATGPTATLWKGQGPGVLSVIALTGIAVLLWLPFIRVRRIAGLQLAYLAVVLLTWTVAVLRIQLDGSLFALGAFAAPVVLLLLATKPPSAADLRIAILVLGYGLAVVAFLSIPLGLMGVMTNGFQAADSAVCRTSLLCDLTGGLNRWAGPFGSVNYAAPVGGLLVVLGLTQRRWHRGLLVASGLVVLLLSQGRSAVLGVLVAIVILIACSPRVSASVHHRAIRTVLIAGSLIAIVAYIVVIDPTFNGRTAIWSDYLHLWSTSPITGVGDSGVHAYVAGREGLLTFTHAHSVLFDSLVRWGVVPALLGLAVFVLALIATARGVRTVGAGPLAVVAFVIAAGATETIHDWAYWSIYVAAATWAVLDAERAPAPIRQPAPSLS